MTHLSVYANALICAKQYSYLCREAESHRQHRAIAEKLKEQNMGEREGIEFEWPPL